MLSCYSHFTEHKLQPKPGNVVFLFVEKKGMSGMTETLHSKGLHDSSFSALTRDARITILGPEVQKSMANGLFTLYTVISNADLKDIYRLNLQTSPRAGQTF